MKKIWIYLLTLLAVNAVQAEEVKPAHIQGKIKNFTGGNVLVYYYNEKIDTLSVDPNGLFDYSVIVESPQGASLAFEEYKCGISLFIENGMDAQLTISFVQKPQEEITSYEPQIVYEGDNQDCTQFMNEYQDWSLYKSPWSFARLDTISFAEYREKFLEDVDSVKSELMKVKSRAFKRMMAAEIDRSIPENLFRFAWSKLRDDADFEQFAESFDRNDPDNIGMAERYMRYYMRNHPAPEGQKGIYYLNSLKQVFANQEIINAFADDYIDGYLKQAPEDMEAVLDVYKKISTNTEAHASADKVYAHYKNLKKGADALDFDMVDKKGGKFHLSDFHGKAVYIDVWATWCGPCCAEIPHMEKLAAHYAKNKKIVLLSISLDENKAKWIKKLAEDKPQWKQFICPDAFHSKLCKNYDINGIPRFLFFDKDGKVISLNALRPSSPDIINYIDRHIR